MSAQQAYELWKIRPNEETRRALREAIERQGGIIVGHGVIAWAKSNLDRGTP